MCLLVRNLAVHQTHQKLYSERNERSRPPTDQYIRRLLSSQTNLPVCDSDCGCTAVLAQLHASDGWNVSLTNNKIEENLFFLKRNTNVPSLQQVFHVLLRALFNHRLSLQGSCEREQTNEHHFGHMNLRSWETAPFFLKRKTDDKQRARPRTHTHHTHSYLRDRNPT